MVPHWYGKKYPSFEQLEAFAVGLGARVGVGDVPGALFVPPGAVDDESPAMILLPERAGLLQRMWLLAHEAGHLARHSGAAPAARAKKVEAQADRWAAMALIPESAVRRHQNASVDAFIAALSAHYEDLPLEDCPQRELAAKIARIRLHLMEEVA